MRKLSLMERRKHSVNKLTLSFSAKSQPLVDPMKRLRDGDYDINKGHLDIVTDSEDDFEKRIGAFLESENIKEVDIKQYMKDMNHFHN